MMLGILTKLECIDNMYVGTEMDELIILPYFFHSKIPHQPSNHVKGFSRLPRYSFTKT